MNFKTISVAGMSLVLAMSPLWSQEASVNSQRARPRWQVGDAWRVEVEQFAHESFLSRGINPDHPSVVNRRKPTAPQSQYSMEIKIAAIVKDDSGPCWAIDFRPGTNAFPVLRTTVFRVLVSQKDRCAREIVRRSGDWGTDGGVIRLGDTYLVSQYPIGYPLHFFPDQAEGESIHTGMALNHHLVLTSTRKGGDTILEQKEIAKRDGKDMTLVRVRQTWADGANWWSDYEVWDVNTLVLRAKAVKKNERRNKGRQ